MKRKVGETRRRTLLRLMDEHKKTSAEVAALVGRKEQTVRAWRCGQYPVPDYALRLLKLLL